MWRILKADLAYDKLVLFIAYGLVFFLKFGEFYQEIFSSLIIAFIAIGIMGSESDKERRERLQTLLPIPAKTLSVSRLLFVIIFQAGMFILWMITALVEPGGSPLLTICIMFTANALFLILINCLILYTDLGFYRNKRYRYIFWAVVLIIAPAIAWVFYNGKMLFFLQKSASMITVVVETIVYNLICLIFFFVNYKVFLGRSSYLK